MTNQEAEFFTKDKAMTTYHKFKTDKGEEYGSFEVWFNEVCFDEDTYWEGWYWHACFPGCEYEEERMFRGMPCKIPHRHSPAHFKVGEVFSRCINAQESANEIERCNSLFAYRI